MDRRIEEGLAKGLIILDADQRNITYKIQNRKFRFTDPEENVRAKAYLSLVLDYGYPPEQIAMEVGVPNRVPNILSDIVIFSDRNLKTPFIVVECKREDASQGELEQAIEQGFGYANSLKAKFLWMTSGIRNDYFDVQEFPAMERVANRLADLPRAGQREISRARYVKGGIGGFELSTVEEAELTRIFKQAHDALWAGGKRNPAEAFDELDKLIFCKMLDERSARLKGEPYDFQVFTNDRGDNLKERIKELYAQGRKRDPEVFKEDIRLSNSELQTVVGYLAAINLNKTDLDSKGRAFETFMTGFFRGDFGQYFTPRNIVKFIVDALPIDNEKLVLDTSCGSGGFLLHVLDKVRRQADEYYDNHDSSEHWRHWHDFAQRNLYGIEISESIARTAKMNMIIHDDGHTNVISFDGLEAIDTIREKSRNQDFAPNHFDFIITNPPFGSKIKFSEKRYLEDYYLGWKDIDWIDSKLGNVNGYRRGVRDQQTTELLFIEQCHRFLKPGGMLAMVVPDSILTNSSLQYARDWIEEHWRIVAVVSLPQFAFAANGAGVKSSVLFLIKYDEATIARIQTTRERTEDRLFKTHGQALMNLIEEKKAALKRGDSTIRSIENGLVAKLEALSAQGTLTSADKRSLKSEARAEIEAHKTTDAYVNWQKELADTYNERIAIIRETLQDDYLTEMKAEIEDYDILMAIAEDIGYDATSRPTANNELGTVAQELTRFIKHIDERNKRPFV